MTFIVPEWKREYDTGVAEIDLQHHFFLALITRLNTELATCTDARYRERLLDELAKYALFHFTSEENLMIKFGYPDFDRHHKLHLELIDELSWRTQGKSHESFLDFLVTWFLKHTVEEDRHIGEFVRGQSVTGS
ncbi:MAG: hemerythrin domain-containing protein [Rhodocyclaceae bacterium]|nr:hemerythrin domain-containing protein [Rhodocyclaceae bacterium]